jgi:hypothetical protein
MNTEQAYEYCQTISNHFLEQLSEWESKFITDVSKHLREGGTLSVKQIQSLDRIMDRCAKNYGNS